MNHTDSYSVNSKNMTDGLVVVDPQNGRRVGAVHSMNADEVNRIIERAVAVYSQHQGLPVHLIVNVINTVADRLSQEIEEFARLISLEGIKTIRESRKEVCRCIDTLRLSAEEARRISGETGETGVMKPGSDESFLKPGSETGVR